MKVHVDKKTFMCFTEPGKDREEFEIPFFDGKCKKFVESFRYIPEKREWTRNDGKVFSGEMLAYGRDSREADAAQTQYEADLAEAAAAYQEGVNSI